MATKRTSRKSSANNDFSGKPPVAIYSRLAGDGEYQNVKSIEEATGITVFRNSANLKQWDKIVAALENKYQADGFRLTTHDKDFARFLEDRYYSVWDILAEDEADNDDLPF